MEIVQLIRDYLAVILSWPVMAFIFAMIAMKLFRSQISRLLERKATVRVGNTELQINQQPAEEAPNREKVYTETELNSLIGDVEKVMAEDLMRADEELQVSKQQMAVLVGQSEYWEFSYLNYFLVPNTKRFLFELSYAVSATASIFENNMILIQKIGVSERSELKAIRDAILQHSLAAENENRGLVLTDKGRRFLRFLGFESPGSSSVT